MAVRFYPAQISQDGDQEGFGAVFADFPGCVSMGDTVQEAAEMAAEALALHVEGMVEEGLTVPAPSGVMEAPEWMMNAPGRLVVTVRVPVGVPGRSDGSHPPRFAR